VIFKLYYLEFQKSHDTIGMVAIDADGNMASGTSTNGARHKIPGRVGDAPITGSGSYVDQQIGGAAATGDGDVLMRFLPSFATVEHMRSGMTPSTAAAYSLKTIAGYYPRFEGAVVAMKKNGEFGAACYGFKNFTYAVANSDLGGPQVHSVDCTLPV
jgi:isoaspartyl peptidase/L-asparaginase-like protein (Ntn-hydrolase superfamily)